MQAVTAAGTAGEDLPALDPNRPSAARIYDYLLGGTHNFAADRDAGQAIIAAFPALPQVLREVRSFVRRSTRFLAGEAGISQFLDLGSGIPTVQNVHEVAQAVNPAARVAYIDIDPIAVAHSRRILAGNPRAICIQGDLRCPAEVCAAPEIRAVIDFSQPVAVLLSAVLHFIEDDAEAAAIVEGYLSAVPPGSYLVICHHTSESTDEDEARARAIYSNRAQPLIPRSKAQIASFFQGLELVEPGVVLTPQWHPDSGPAAPADGSAAAVPPYFAYVGVGRKPVPQPPPRQADAGLSHATGAALKEDPGPLPPEVDAGKASAARVYDYWLGGTHNFAADRAAARALIAVAPRIRAAAQANRAFLGRAVRFMAASGVRQFIDIGSGIPTRGNVHEIAQAAAPGARVVYADIDPVAVAHSEAILKGNAAATVIRADVREPAQILASGQVLELIDFCQPVGLVLAAVLHFVPDEDDPWQIVATFLDALPSGSCLLVSHVTAEGRPAELTEMYQAAYNRSVANQGRLRSRAAIERFFAGLQVAEPGIVAPAAWRPDSPPGPLEDLYLLAGVGRKP